MPEMLTLQIVRALLVLASTIITEKQKPKNPQYANNAKIV